MIYKSSVDSPSETEAIDESCFDFIGDFIGDVSNDFFPFSSFAIYVLYMYFEGSRPTSGQ